MKYKINDKVKIGGNYPKSGDFDKGKIFTIISPSPFRDKWRLDKRSGDWQESWLEPVEDEPETKYKIGARVQEIYSNEMHKGTIVAEGRDEKLWIIHFDDGHEEIQTANNYHENYLTVLPPITSSSPKKSEEDCEVNMYANTNKYKYS